MLYSGGVFGSRSEKKKLVELRTRSFVFDWVAMVSRIGAIILQDRTHSAQKSSARGENDLTYVLSNARVGRVYDLITHTMKFPLGITRSP